MLSFSSGAGYTVGPFEFESLVGFGQVVKSPWLLPTFFPKIGGLFTLVPVSTDLYTTQAQLDIQFQNDDREEDYDIKVELVRLPAIDDQLTKFPSGLFHLPVIGSADFTFPAELKTFEDETVEYRNVWSLRHPLKITDPHLHKGDRIALRLNHSNMSLFSVCVTSSASFYKVT
jgi:hypothetical protein